jgi:hypothetical protein
MIPYFKIYWKKHVVDLELPIECYLVDFFTKKEVFSKNEREINEENFCPKEQ